MLNGLTIQMVLAFAVLALCIFAYGESSTPAWWWMVLIGTALAVIVFGNAWLGRRAALAEPISAKVATFVLAELVLPVLVVLAALASWGLGGGIWFDMAIVLAVTLACATLL